MAPGFRSKTGELLISSSMKIDPRIADEVELLEALMRTK